jgi:hypothetical protein
MRTILQMAMSVTLICMASGGASAANNASGSAEDIASVCLAGANLCTETCNLNPTGGSSSFSEGLSNALSCNDKCADSYGACVGDLARKSHKKDFSRMKVNSVRVQ